MPRNALSLKAIKIAAENSGNPAKAKALLRELLTPKNSEMSIKKVKWQVSKSNW